MLFKQVAEAKDGRLVRRGGHAQIDSGKAAQHGRLIEGFFHARVRQAEPLLQKVSPQHDRQAHRLPAVARLGVKRLNQRQQLRPRNHLVHLVKKQLPLALAAMLLKTRLRCQCLLKTRHSLHTYSLFKDDAGCRLVQRFPKRGQKRKAFKIVPRVPQIKDVRVSSEDVQKINAHTMAMAARFVF